MISISAKTDFPRDLGAKTQRAIVRLLQRVGSEARIVAVAKAPRDTGQLINSITIVRPRKDFLVGGITTNLPYAIVMEDGREPGKKFPPLLPIQRWVLRHRDVFGIKDANSKKGQRQLKSVTYLVRRKIAKKGIPGHFFFRSAEIKIRSEFGRQIEALGLEIQLAWNGG